MGKCWEVLGRPSELQWTADRSEIQPRAVIGEGEGTLGMKGVYHPIGPGSAQSAQGLGAGTTEQEEAGIYDTLIQRSSKALSTNQPSRKYRGV